MGHSNFQDPVVDGETIVTTSSAAWWQKSYGNEHLIFEMCMQKKLRAQSLQAYDLFVTICNQGIPGKSSVIFRSRW